MIYLAKKRFPLPIGVLALALLAAAPVSAGANEGTGVTLRFGVVPQQSASELARRWTPILVYLSEKTGYRLQFATAKDIPTFEKRLAAGEYDLAYMNPYHYTVFHRSPGATACSPKKRTGPWRASSWCAATVPTVISPSSEGP